MRYTSEHLPEYAHRPGQTIHPNKSGGHSYMAEAPAERPLTAENFIIHQEYLFGVDLYNKGYFWEAHVYWEAAWNGSRRTGDAGNFLKGLILLAAARLKWEVKQPKPALGHFKRSLELISELDGDEQFGFKVSELVDDLQRLIDALSSSSDELSIVQNHSLTLNVE